MLRRKAGQFFIKKDREGSSLVSVVIGVLFLAAIGIIVLTVANKYMIAVNVDHNTAKNFYDSEAVLEEVKTGLLEYAGEAAEDAYRYVLENYNQNKNSKREIFSKKYLELLAGKLMGTSYVIEDDKIGKAQPAKIDKLKVLSKVPEAVTLKKGSSELAFVIRKDESTNEYSLVIRNMLIDYTDDVGYQTSIQTDICMTVPDHSLEGNSTFDAMKDYISISDETLEVSPNQTENEIRGNVYTGNDTEGIVLGQDSSVNFLSPLIISRGDLKMYNGAEAHLDGEAGENGDLYLKNIHLATLDSASTKETKLTLHENAYIANDLNIESNNATVTLGGKYYGYSYNKDNNGSSSDVATSEYSSAILINGRDTTLKTDNLKSLILSGRAFVSREKSDNTKLVSDIMMGESVSVKSNQIAYLVPDKYITSTTGNSDDYQNPVFKSDMSMVRIDVDKLRQDFGDYLVAAGDPYEKNYNNDIGYVFFYLKFKDQVAANKYFEDYYSRQDTDEDGEVVSHKDQLGEKGKVYISDKDLGIKFDQTLFRLAGNVLNNYYGSNGTGLQQANYYDSQQKPYEDLLSEGRRMGRTYVGYQLGLSPAAYTGTNMRLPIESEDGALVSTKVLDTGKITSDITKNADETKVEGAALMVRKSGCSISGLSVKKGLLIVKGDVTVDADFTGLILATGKVTVTNKKLKLASDMVTVGKLFDYIRTDEELSSLFLELNGAVKKRPANLSECIFYQNWSKNSH